MAEPDDAHQDDPRRTLQLIRDAGTRGLACSGDLADRSHCADVMARSVDDLGGLDLLVNDVAPPGRCGHR